MKGINVRRYTVGLVTTSILGALLCFYFMFYVSRQDDEIRERNFRVLRQTIANVNGRTNDYSKLFQSAVNRVNDSLHAHNRLTVEQVKEYLKEFGQLTDTVFLDSTKTKDRNMSLVADDSHFLCYRYSLFDVRNKKVSDRVRAAVGVSLYRFMSPIIRQDAFTHYMLLDSTEVIYKNFPEGFIVTKFDSLFSPKASFKSNSVREFNFGGDDYTLFITPFELADKKKLSIIGMLPSSKLNSEKYSVPGAFVLVTLLILFLIFLSFPLIKALLMNKNERLNAIDVLSAFVCFMFSFALILFVLFHGYHSHLNERELLDKNQAKLCEEIESSFRNDIIDAYRQLDACDMQTDSVLCAAGKINFDSESAEGFTVVCKKPEGEQHIIKPTIYPHFKLAFWLDAQGDDIINWTTDSTLPNSANYRDREYFKRIRNNATWKLPVSTMNAPFTMQPIYSWTDGDFRAVLAKESHHVFPQMSGWSQSKTSVLAGISSRLPSVINAVLPLGYSFCIMDVNGEVWFHSDVTKNLKENFILECEENSKLVSAMYSRTSVFFTEHYAGSDNRIYISPVEGLPLFVAVMRDTTPFGIRSIEVFSITTILYFTISLFFVFLLFVFVLLSRRNSKLKARFFQVHWLWPSSDNRSEYIKIFLLNILLFITGLSITSAENPLYSLLIFITNALLTLSSFYYMGILKELNCTGTNRKRYFFITVSVLALAILFAGFNALDTVHVTYIVLYFGYSIFTSYVVLFRKYDRVEIMVEAKKKIPERLKDYGLIYSLMIFAWLLVVVLLPMFRFYDAAYRAEAINLLRYNQLHIAKQISGLTRNSAGGENNHFVQLNEGGSAYHNIYISSVAHTSLRNDNTMALPADTAKNDSLKEAKLFSRFVKEIRILVDGHSTLEQELFPVSERDSVSLVWNMTTDSLLLSYRDYRASHGAGGNVMHFASTLPQHISWFKKEEAAVISPPLFLAILITLCMLLLCVVRYFVNKFFLVHYFADKVIIENNPLYFDKNEINLTAGRENRKSKIILVSLPNSGRKEFIESLVEDKTMTNILDVDFVKMDSPVFLYDIKTRAESLTEDSTIILNHFEFKLYDSELNKKKIEIIEYLLPKTYRNIIISTTIHPLAFLESLKKNKSATDINDFTSEGDYFRWSMLLSSFQTSYFPLKQVKHKRPDNCISTATALARKECSFGTFLHKQKNNIRVYDRENNTPFTEAKAEEVILMIQHASSAYYLSVWHSLTREEQYVLFDMAEDELANYKNREALTLLFYKGIIIHDGMLKIMNRSFKNFILTEVNQESVIISDEARSRGSNWQKFKTPFFIIGMVVMFFIFYTQQETFNQFVALIASFTAGLPFILRLFTMIPTGKST